MLTPRERWHAVLAEEQPDRVHCDYAGTPEVTARPLRDWGCTSGRPVIEMAGDRQIDSSGRETSACEGR